MEERNWAGNLRYAATALHRPADTTQVQELVRTHGRLKALGTRHAFNSSADTDGVQLSLEKLDTIAIDPQARSARVGAGVRYGDLGPRLEAAGLALPNLASLPHICIAGACATATHGSGDGNGNLATAVSAVELVRADGQVVEFRRDRDPELAGAVVGLGALGVVTGLTLDLVPSFSVRQDVYTGLPFDHVHRHIDALMANAYSVSLFTDWASRRFRLWLKRRLDEEDAAGLASAAGVRATTPQHPIAGLPAHTCTEQLGIPGPWHLRLPHFSMEQTPSVGDELQSEYFVPREHAADALSALDGLRQRIAPLLHVSEVRSVAADDLWLSPCYRRAGLALHFTWKKDWEGVRGLLPLVEEALEPLAPRPHWGKLFTLPAARLHRRYEKLEAFRALVRRLDPHGKFNNAFLRRHVLGC